MTLENAKRLYDHYMSIGNHKAAKELVDRRPEILKMEEETIEEVLEEEPKEEESEENTEEESEE